MGLDMYLFKLRKNDEIQTKYWLNIAFSLDFDNINDINFVEYLKKYTYLIEENEKSFIGLVKRIAYWRKVNHIHNWIYRNCATPDQEDFELIEVRKEQLEELRELCNKVDESNCVSLLPRTSGFFFGSMDYDKAYFSENKDTILMIDEVLDSLEKDEVMFYYADY